MIALSRLNGRTVAVNPDLIVWIDVTPDTTLCMAGGERIVVRESLDDVLNRITTYRKMVGPIGAAAADVAQSGNRRAMTSERAPARASFRQSAKVEVTPARPSIRTTQPSINRK